MNMNNTNIYEIGDIVEFSSCEESIKSYNHIFFKKNGGWGIASEEGKVILSNNLEYPLSQSKLGYIDSSLVIVKNIATGLYGVISQRYAKEIIPCNYTFIETKTITHPSNYAEHLAELNHELYFLVNIGGSLQRDSNSNEVTVYRGVWGILNESGDTIIPARYYKIYFKYSYLECYSTEEIIHDEHFRAQNASYYYTELHCGSIDLFTINGEFIVGGINCVEYYNNYILLYIGVKYDYVEESKSHDYCDGYILKYTLHHPVKSFDESACLIINNQFKPVLKSKPSLFHNNFHIGMTFLDKDDFCDRLSAETIIKGCSIDMQEFNTWNLLFLRYPNNIFFIPEFQSNFKEIISLNVLVNGNYQDVNLPRGKWKDNIIEDEVCVIAKISEDGSIVWSHRVNNITQFDDTQYIYQDGDYVGLFTRDKFLEAKYSAFSLKKLPNKNYVVAIKQHSDRADIYFNNPNYNFFSETKISYYELTDNNELIKIDDDWNIFDPREKYWFPESFKEDNGLFYDYDHEIYLSPNDNKNPGCSWTKEMLREAEDIALEGNSWLELGLD